MNRNPMNIMQLVSMMKQGNNPMQILQQMAAQNPQAAQAMQIIQGKSPEQLKQIAANMAKERGIDLNEYIASLQAQAQQMR